MHEKISIKLNFIKQGSIKSVRVVSIVLNTCILVSGRKKLVIEDMISKNIFKEILAGLHEMKLELLK